MVETRVIAPEHDVEEVARLALGLGTGPARAVSWDARPLHSGVSTSDVHRVAGIVRDGGTDFPFSVVLKILRPDATRPGWRREADAYGSGCLDRLPPGVSAARCYRIVERAEGISLWLEDLGDALTRPWSIDEYGEAAFQLGRFGGAFLVGHPLPLHPWLVDESHRAWIALCSPAMARLAAHPNDPEIRRYWPGRSAEAVLRLWEERHRVLAILDRAPRVVCHHDFHRHNLALQSSRVVAIDWADAGIGCLAQDLTGLVGASTALFDADPADLAALNALAFRRYVEGLRAAGWSGSEREVHLTHLASMALVGALHPWGAVPPSDERRRRIERALNRSYDEAMERTTQIRLFCLGLADELRNLV